MKRAMVFSAALLLSVAAILFAQFPAVTRFVINPPATEPLGNDGQALSPDGKTLVYQGRRAGVTQLYRRSMDQSL